MQKVCLAVKCHWLDTVMCVCGGASWYLGHSSKPCSYTVIYTVIQQYFSELEERGVIFISSSMRGLAFVGYVWM